MQLSKIRIRNYRLLIDAELEVDPKTTLIETTQPRHHASCALVMYWKGKIYPLMIIHC
jgi:hypothetical protein